MTEKLVLAPPTTSFVSSRAGSLLRSARRPGTATVALALGTLLLVTAWALVPGVFAPGDPIAGSLADALQPPSAAHWFGTDATGRDVYTRVVHGAANTLASALLAVSLGLIVGTLLGLVAGSGPRWVDASLMRLVDVLLSIPGLLLSLSVIIILGFGLMQIALAVAVTSIAAFARLVRGEVLRVRSADFIEAAYASGGTFGTVMFRHILPNSLAPVFALAALQFGMAILAISALGFLGYGAPPPAPEWGLMIAEGRDYVATAWWLTTIPGIVVVLVVLATNRLSAAISTRSAR
ncbi:MAG: peptide ABC transporter permease [Microbacterium sp.]|jgi:peptide/nickel transport system permease protein|uniref:ABC transporter permease n=1 Tax=Microbacterium sp. TaxID=51671 RepID=UPI000DB3FC1D|nr:ABC transporter permease [Microbacterium sp.]PZU36174.1 MAG: peptide ABC transporter permease [Microbacterium sp.]